MKTKRTLFILTAFLPLFLYPKVSFAGFFNSDAKKYLDTFYTHAICFAIYENDFETVKALIKENQSCACGLVLKKPGEDLRQTGPISPASLALLLDRTQILQYMIQQDKALKKPNNHVSSFAIEHHSLESIKRLIQYGMPIDLIYQDNTTMLDTAIYAKAPDIASYLMQSNIKPENSKQFSRLAYNALLYGNLELYKTLVRDKNIPKVQNPTQIKRIVNIAVSENHLDVLRYLMSNNTLKKQTQFVLASDALLRASARGHLDLAKFLLQQGADIDFVDGQGNTAFSFVSRLYFEDLTTLQQYTSPENTNNWHKNILVNRMQPLEKSMMFLLEAGANVNHTPPYQPTPLIQALMTGSEKHVALFLKHGADVNARSKEEHKSPPLIFAAENNLLTSLKSFVERGADVNAQDSFGDSALIYAAGNGHLEAVKYLLAHGAIIDQKTQDGDTALLAAAEKGALPTFEYLVTQGADIYHKNKFGKGVVEWATKTNDPIFLKALEKYRLK